MSVIARSTEGDGTEYFTCVFDVDLPLGIHIASSKHFGFNGSRAVVVKFLVPNGQAHTAKQLCAGDIITRVNGATARSYPAVITQIKEVEPPLHVEFFRISRARLGNMLMHGGMGTSDSKAEGYALDGLVESAKNFFSEAFEQPEAPLPKAADHGLKVLSLEHVPELAEGAYADTLYQAIMQIAKRNETGRVGDFTAQCRNYGGATPDELMECAREFYLYLQSAFGPKHAARMALDLVQLLPEFHRRCALLVQAGLLAPEDMPPIPGATETAENKGVIKAKIDKLMRGEKGEKLKQLMNHDRVKMTLPLWLFIPGSAVITVAAMGSILAEERVKAMKESSKSERFWVPDSLAQMCHGCSVVFTMLKRRHHCRKCSNVFCNVCTSQRALLKEQGFTVPTRVCDSCYIEVLNGDELFRRSSQIDNKDNKKNSEKNDTEQGEEPSEAGASATPGGGGDRPLPGLKTPSSSGPNRIEARKLRQQQREGQAAGGGGGGGGEDGSSSLQWQSAGTAALLAAEKIVHDVDADSHLPVMRYLREAQQTISTIASAFGSQQNVEGKIVLSPRESQWVEKGLQFVQSLLVDGDNETIVHAWLCDIKTRSSKWGISSAIGSQPMRKNWVLVLSSVCYYTVHYDAQLNQITEYHKESFTQVRRVYPILQSRTLGCIAIQEEAKTKEVWGFEISHDPITEFFIKTGLKDELKGGGSPRSMRRRLPLSAEEQAQIRRHMVAVCNSALAFQWVHRRFYTAPADVVTITEADMLAFKSTVGSPELEGCENSKQMYQVQLKQQQQASQEWAAAVAACQELELEHEKKEKQQQENEQQQSGA